MAAPFNEWVKRRWALLIIERGSQCEICEATFFLEFAHIKPTRCKGEGRGKYRRLRDILRYPKRYRLLCMDCHDDFDGRARRRRQEDYVKQA